MVMVVPYLLNLLFMYNMWTPGFNSQRNKKNGIQSCCMFPHVSKSIPVRFFEETPLFSGRGALKPPPSPLPGTPLVQRCVPHGCPPSPDWQPQKWVFTAQSKISPQMGLSTPTGQEESPSQSDRRPDGVGVKEGWRGRCRWGDAESSDVVIM